jgi:hypothetical protein
MSLIPFQIEEKVRENLSNKFPRESMPLLSQRFQRDGMIKIPEIMPIEIRQAMKQEALRLLHLFAERRDLKLITTDNTPRKMSVVTSEIIASNSEVINILYRVKALINFLEDLAGEPLLPCPSKDEEFLITRQEKSGDTHGWHWGDYRFALIWVLETPPIDCGGMLQCIPHTSWDKSNPRIHEYLCENPIRTYSFVSGDIYFLKADTTLHRTVPLNRDATRIILNMTWGSLEDESKKMIYSDRWWSKEEVDAGIYS